jgi:hypothetical protein
MDTTNTLKPRIHGIYKTSVSGKNKGRGTKKELIIRNYNENE